MGEIGDSAQNPTHLLLFPGNESGERKAVCPLDQSPGFLQVSATRCCKRQGPEMPDVFVTAEQIHIWWTVLSGKTFIQSAEYTGKCMM